MDHTVRTVAALLWAAWLMTPTPGVGQSVEFKVAWTNVGEGVSSAGNDAVPIQRGTKVARVDVQPTVVEVAVGTQVCVGTLQVRAFGADGKPIAGVSLEIAVRQDQKVQLQLTRSKGLCMRPARSGEYPVRFTSKVPAADDSLRGAQIFVRAR